MFVYWDETILVPCPLVQLLVGQLRIPFAYAPQVYRRV